MDEILTVEEAARLLKVPTSYVYERTAKRAIPHIKLGRKVRFERLQLLAWARNHRVEIEGNHAEADEYPVGDPDLAPEDEAVAVA